MDPLVSLLMAWIGAHSDYDTAGLPLPRVVELDAAALTREYYDGVAHLMPEDGVDERLNALYAAVDGPNGTIYILDAALAEGADHFDDPRDNPIWREILLHELVHHAQWQSGEAGTWLCPAQGERAAYRIGGQYLRAQHIDDPLANRAFWGEVYARC